MTDAEGALSPEQIRRLAAEASTRLEGVENSLSQQVLALQLDCISRLVLALQQADA